MPLSSVLGAQSLVRPGVCTSSTRPASPFEGQVIYETDTKKTLVYNGSAWAILSDVGAWTSYTPTWTGISSTGGSSTGGYIQHGKVVHFWARYLVGSSSISVTGAITPSLPVSRRVGDYSTFSGYFTDSGTGWFFPLTVGETMYAANSNGTYVSASTPSGTVPITWAVNDQCVISGTYEAA